MLSHLSGLVCLSETEPHYGALADKHHAVQTKLPGKSQIFAWPCPQVLERKVYVTALNNF